jgi:hypothetical protein
MISGPTELEAHMQRLVPCALAGLLVLGLAESAARAQTKAAVLGVEAVDAPAEPAGRLTEALRAQVRQSPGFRLAQGKSLEEIKLVFGCVDEKPDCMARVGRSLGAAKLIWGNLRKAGAGYNLTIKYLDVASATVEKFVSENVAATDLSDRAVPTLIERLTRSFLPGGHGALRISSNVEGAAVEVAGRPAGVTLPGGLVVGNLSPGRVEVRVTKPGFRMWSQSVVVAAGETAYVDAQLEAAPEVGPGPGPGPGPQPATQPAGTPSTRTGWKAAFWTTAALTVGFGAAIVGTGVTVLSKQTEKNDAIDGPKSTLTSDQRNLFRGNPPPDACKVAEGLGDAGKAVTSACDSGNKFATMTNVFIGLTAAAAVAAGFLYYKAYIQKDAPEAAPPPSQTARRQKPGVDWAVAPSVGPTGGSLGLHMRF